MPRAYWHTHIAMPIASEMRVARLGEARIPNPFSTSYIDDRERLVHPALLSDVQHYLDAGEELPSFEIAGPREHLLFDPGSLRCGIVTCGGLCPGLNDVIRAVVLSLHHHYGVRTVLGFRYGYEGLGSRGLSPAELTPATVDCIHLQGGTVLGSSRGPESASTMVDTLERLGVGILFVVGGDGTLRGAQAIAEEVRRRGRAIGVIGIPKTIDNDIAFIQQSFGFETAVIESRHVIRAANSEAVGARNGVGLVKLMGRHSGFIAAYATLANGDVNFCLVPEVPFSFDGFMAALGARLAQRGHAVIVVAEGAGQDLLATMGERDASGNVRLADIGVFLRDHILEHCRRQGSDVSLKYIDPSYAIRSAPANARDAAFCLALAHNAVHAGMAGRTDMVVGYWKHEFTHVPIALAVSERKQIDPAGRLWSHVLGATGQPRAM
jgi:6-phosphofructokinase 1